MSNTYPLTLFYDGACPLCNTEMGYLRQRDVQAQLRFVDISMPGVPLPSGTDLASMMQLMHAQCADGRVLVGVEVFRLAYSAVGLPWVTRLTRLPGLSWLSERLYPVIARNRYRMPSRVIAWLYARAIQRSAQSSLQRARCDAQCRVDATPRKTNKAVHS